MNFFCHSALVSLKAEALNSHQLKYEKKLISPFPPRFDSAKRRTNLMQLGGLVSKLASHCGWVVASSPRLFPSITLEPNEQIHTTFQLDKIQM